MTPLIGSVRVGMASAPSNPAAGELYYDTDDDILYAYNGTAWGKISAVTATGGTETTYSGYKAHTFTEDGTFIVSGGSITVDYLMIAGGGAGGTNGGGGGAGGVILGQSETLGANSYTIVVGDGGDGHTYECDVHNNGENTTFNGETAVGGGSGGSCNTGRVGGSGGGGGYLANNVVAAGGAGTANQGYAGGNGMHDTKGYGGGGGAGSVGESNTGGVQGGGQNDGGNGIENNYRTGSNVWYAGGGGGGRQSGSPAGNGIHGGGNGNTQELTAFDATDGTGGGGGGSGGGSGISGDGGSGIVVIRYAA